MRRKMIMGPALAATLLLTALLPSAASTPVPRWTPQPYRQYLIKLEVERDTITAPSVMLHGAKTKRKVDVSHFKVGPFWVPDPRSSSRRTNGATETATRKGGFSATSSRTSSTSFCYNYQTTTKSL